MDWQEIERRADLARQEDRYWSISSGYLVDLDDAIDYVYRMNESDDFSSKTVFWPDYRVYGIVWEIYEKFYNAGFDDVQVGELYQMTDGQLGDPPQIKELSEITVYRNVIDPKNPDHQRIIFGIDPTELNPIELAQRTLDLTGNPYVDQQILSEVDGEILIKLCQTNKQIKTLCQDDNLWKEKLRKDVGPFFEPKLLNSKPKNVSYQEAYTKFIDLKSELYNRYSARTPIRKIIINGEVYLLLLLEAYYKQKGEKLSLPFYDQRDYLASEAASYGQIGSLDYLLGFGMTPGRLTIQKAGENGQLDVLKWLRIKGLDNDMSAALTGAAKNGHLNVLNWVYDNYGYLPNEYSLLEAQEKGHDDVVNWAAERGMYPAEV